MDITYLLFLQDLRESAHNLPTPFMKWVSLFAVTWLPLIPIFIYWCVDKKKGLYLLASLAVCRACSSLLKLTACVYRPWIRDARIVPAGHAIATAGGYSFPSGHTIIATAVCGGIAAAFRERGKTLVALCLVLIVLTAFSRNYLGVHTPQDVAGAICLGAAALYGVARLFALLDERPELEDRILLGGFLFAVAALAYIALKSYPMDYGADGKLLVNPGHMMRDGFRDMGLLMGFCAGRYVEKRWVRFRVTGVNARGVALAALGFVLLSLLQVCLGELLKAACGGHWGRLLTFFILAFFTVAVWPAVIRRFAGSGERGCLKSSCLGR
ncbi:MAG: phosphatase PAP2 family protein [Deltaproteobacteria bacterium]|nr:phosphatase PAP2 family protein [Deltaproteobacteria bacterium]